MAKTKKQPVIQESAAGFEEISTDSGSGNEQVTFDTRNSKDLTVNRTTLAKRSGLTFPPTRFRKNMQKANYAPHIGVAAGIYSAAVLEYLVAEVMELAGNVANDNKKQRITPRHLMLAIRNDEELSRLTRNAMFSEAGVFPNIIPVLLQPKTPLHLSKARFNEVMQKGDTSAPKSKKKKQNAKKKEVAPVVESSMDDATEMSTAIDSIAVMDTEVSS